jgi:hypothetical protein
MAVLKNDMHIFPGNNSGIWLNADHTDVALKNNGCK